MIYGPISYEEWVVLGEKQHGSMTRTGWPRIMKLNREFQKDKDEQGGSKTSELD
jgi:hypothetical protein